jgi:hypothetical protein
MDLDGVESIYLEKESRRARMERQIQADKIQNQCCNAATEYKKKNPQVDIDLAETTPAIMGYVRWLESFRGAIYCNVCEYIKTIPDIYEPQLPSEPQLAAVARKLKPAPLPAGATKSSAQPPGMHPARKQPYMPPMSEEDFLTEYLRQELEADDGDNEEEIQQPIDTTGWDKQCRQSTTEDDLDALRKAIDDKLNFL